MSHRRISGRAFTVEEDAGSTGIWVLEEGAWVSVEYEALDLPQELIDRFIHWTQWYMRPFDDEQFETEGRALAEALKTHLGPSVTVSYGKLGQTPNDDDVSTG